MATKKLTVVISQSQSRNPAKRQLEESIVTELILDPEIDASLVPHLYDMSWDHSGNLFLRSIRGDLVVLSWLYPRAARWILDRDGVRGHEGQTLIDDPDDVDDEEEIPEELEDRGSEGNASADIPDRKIYCVDLRADTDPKVFLAEIRRIASESAVHTVELMDWIQGNPDSTRLERYLHPERLMSGDTSDTEPQTADSSEAGPEPAKRRWYPVIDYSRCTNCMECIDFCLFGVYGADQADRILVEQQDNCKKGCPACSRVCPENAIIFPQHKTPAISGADGEVASIKIDLSKLFGGNTGESPLEMAVKERDTELVADGREAVGATVGMPKRQSNRDQKPRDELDDLMDGLDSLEF